MVRQAFLGCNCTRTALYVGSAVDGRVVTKLDEESTISHPRWTPDGRHLSYLSPRSGAMQLWQISASGGVPEQVFAHRANADGGVFPVPLLGPNVPVGVASYEWSPDGRFIAFTAMRPVDPAARRRAEDNGIRYDDERMTVLDVNNGRWLSAQRRAQLWIYDVRAKHARLLWQTPAGTWARISSLSWSPDGRRLAVAFPHVIHGLRYTAGVVDVVTGRFTTTFDIDGLINTATWAPDGHSIALLSFAGMSSEDSILSIVHAGSTLSRVIARGIMPGSPATLMWVRDRLYFGSDGMGGRHDNGGLYEVGPSGGSISRLTPIADKVADCDNPVGSRVACVWQSPVRPPRIAIVDLGARSVRLLADVNPEMESIALGPVRELHWANAFGKTANGYLVLPPGDHSTRTHLPLVVMGYGFNGDFVAQANWWLTSYPAQAFARDGFAVLLINHPNFGHWQGDDFARGARAWGYGPLSTLKVIVDRLRREGIVDANRVGFMGHSWSGFWVQFAASQSNLLRAAELQNGGTETEPSSYSDSGQSGVRVLQDHVMGGGPYPPTLRNYVGYSPVLTADRVRIPMLLEDDAAEAPLSLDYYTALIAHHVPVDFIIYPADGHNFMMPAHRMASMQRNLDWFEFWLLGKERAAPDAAGRYALWERMRSSLRMHDAQR